MSKVKGIETFAVVPLSKYKKLINKPEDVKKEDDSLPEGIKMLLASVQGRFKNTCLLILHHLSTLNGAVSYNTVTGEIVLDNTNALGGTNMGEVLRILHKPKQNVSPSVEEEMGTGVIVDILAAFTSLPVTTIHHPYWRAYMIYARSDKFI